jgi:2-C-methyl-D-erythritol 2,4-cyclodiphosphate synthase
MGKVIRIGSGYDVHAFVGGEKLILGGVEVPFEKGLKGHSDADVLLHAIIDALLGASALGDIGTHFPPTDPAYKDISSLMLLSRTLEIIKSSGFAIVNIDSTIVCEAPKLALFMDRMVANIADTLMMDARRVSVKATTTEGLGFIGTGEGIAAYSSVLVEES